MRAASCNAWDLAQELECAFRTVRSEAGLLHLFWALVVYRPLLGLSNCGATMFPDSHCQCRQKQQHEAPALGIQSGPAEAQMSFMTEMESARQRLSIVHTGLAGSVQAESKIVCVNFHLPHMALKAVPKPVHTQTRPCGSSAVRSFGGDRGPSEYKPRNPLPELCVVPGEPLRNALVAMSGCIVCYTCKLSFQFDYHPPLTSTAAEGLDSPPTPPRPPAVVFRP